MNPFIQINVDTLPKRGGQTDLENLEESGSCRQGGENKCSCVYRTNGRPENGAFSQGFCGTLLGVLCSCCYTSVSNKNTCILLLVEKSSFFEDGLENPCAEKRAWGGISSLDTNSASDIASNSCMYNCGAAINEMKGNFHGFSFSFLKSSSYTIPSEIYVCHNSS